MASKPNQKRTTSGRFGNVVPWEPTPAEIESACAKIRQEWSETCRARRRYGASVPSHQGHYMISGEAGEIQ